MAVRGTRVSSTSDSGGAPENFHITYSHDGTDDEEAIEATVHDGDLLSASSFQIGGLVGGSTLRCPLCGAHRRQFHCKSCIRHGDFLHTATGVYHLPERFVEKQQRLRNLRTANATLEAKGTHMLAKHFHAGKLAGEIKQRTDRANIIRKTIELKRTAIEELRAKQRSLGDEIRKLRIKLPRYDDKVKNLSEFVMRKLEESEHRKAQLATVQDRLRLMKRDHVQQLVRYIFPITQTIVSRSQLTVGGNISTASSSSGGSSQGPGNTRSTINEISDATRTAYVRGQWVLQDSFGEVQHVIVAPALPGTGNYSAYPEWTTGTGGTVTVLDPPSVATSTGGENPYTPRVGCHNPAHTIAAALTYTTQLVHLIAFYLDVLLPFRVAYSDFCTTALPEAQFTRKVARLNADIVHLCHTQGCRLNDMNPTHTLENVLCLLKSPDLGLCGPTDRTSCLSDSMEQLLVQHIGEDSDSEDETIIHQEWEAVPSNLSPVTVEQPYLPLEHRHRAVGAGGHYPHGLQQPPAAATSLMTSAFASVSSFWKGWTGK
ncbi:beclin 1-associated autophagy-related key regulator [Anopheles ziemanni]|uniref:beclin 1-associated autophagy-related key regulator n=1 Tax=Anopheles coustani TaxID=139045 RepID=UPI002658827B|nr:beclin 1-associated autophagy-related key regulator [Anopheles coustani]XP_058174349.1 beclin 1-associated autophagy-related key regulator [Anopheles ziemanni]